MLKILFIGDIVGKIGRKTVAQILPKLKRKEKIDLVIANGENSAHGSGITEKIAKELNDCGIDWFTMGDHAFKNISGWNAYQNCPIIRPANFPPTVPGKGFALIPVKKGNVLLINLIGRVFMKLDYDCPFRKIDEILADINLAKEKLCGIIIDIHAEATSEKAALFHYLNGKVSAILGTHTHVMTADAQISEEGTAFISDVGMCGYGEGCIGLEKEGIIKAYLDQIKYKHSIPEKGGAIFNGVILEINSQNIKAIKINTILKTIKIK